jgi:hypothetical protein
MGVEWQSGTFVFTLQHEHYLHGENPRPAALLTGKQAIQQFNILFGMITLPMILVITLLVSLAGHPVQLLLPILLLTGLTASSYFAYRRYHRDRKLSLKGQVIYGSIVHREELAPYPSATGTITRVIYRFQMPDGTVHVDRQDLSFPGDRLPDGRKYPQVGTPVAVLYADPHTYLLL